MIFDLDTLPGRRFAYRSGGAVLALASSFAVVACTAHTSIEGSSGSTSGGSSSSGAGGATASSSSSASGNGGAAPASSSSSASGGSGGSNSSTGSSSSASSGGAVDVCGAASKTLAWTASIPATAATLGLLDIAAGPTDDVIVADMSGAATFEQHRWNSAGASVSVHQDMSGDYVGPLLTTNLFVDAQNDLFYGMMLTGLPMGTSSQAELIFTRLSPSGTTVFTQTSTATMPTTAAGPSVKLFAAGGDSGGGLHSPLVMNAPVYFTPGVYCYSSSGDNEGASAGTDAALLDAGDFMWPAPDGNLYLIKAVTSSVNLGCGSVTVPAAGAVVLASLTGGGNCNWSKPLALPTAAVKESIFRIGGDGSLLLAVVYSGTINFGGADLQSTGTSSLALAHFDTSGNLLWGKPFGGAGSSFKLGSLSSNAAGTIVLTGGYAGAVNLGGGALPATGDTVLAVFDSTGALQWNKVVTVGTEGKLLAAAGKCGLVLATNSPTVNLGTGPLSKATPPAPATIGVAALGL
jgi:hypothetical protein